jgi:hypothetical protein
MPVNEEPTCDICNQPSTTGLFTCKQCGNQFCETCGDPAEQICDECEEIEAYFENEPEQPETPRFKQQKAAATPGQTHF